MMGQQLLPVHLVELFRIVNQIISAKMRIDLLLLTVDVRATSTKMKHIVKNVHRNSCAMVLCKSHVVLLYWSIISIFYLNVRKNK